MLWREKVANKPKHWVRAVTACNSRCLFCLDSDTPRNVYLDVADIQAEIDRGIDQLGAEKLILSGGKQKLPRDGTGQSVYVRAEDVQISEKGSLTGQVENVTFLGTHYRIGVKGIAPDLLTSILVGQTAPNIGDTVSVSIHPDSLLILPKGADEE